MQRLAASIILININTYIVDFDFNTLGIFLLLRSQNWRTKNGKCKNIRIDIVISLNIMMFSTIIFNVFFVEILP